MPIRELTALLAMLCIAGSAAAVVIASGDGSGNTGPAPDDFGWAHVGRLGTVSAVGIGGSCVLTAWHAIRNPTDPDRGVEVKFGSRTHHLVPGSERTLGGGILPEPADLALFRVTPPTPLPQIPIAAQSPALGTAVVLLGNGRNRAAAPLTWDSQWTPVERGQHSYFGFPWAKGRTLRWGTNLISQSGLRFSKNGTQTLAFATRFDRIRGTEHESQAAKGDSGGAAFAHIDGTWQLIGVLFAVGNEPGQTKSAVYGNFTFIADLARYRDEILEIRARDCDNSGTP